MRFRGIHKVKATIFVAMLLAVCGVFKISALAENTLTPTKRPANFAEFTTERLSEMTTAAGDVVIVPRKKPLPLSPEQRLSKKDAQLYQQIFTLQRGGHWDDADKLIYKLADMRLMGHVLEQRLMHPTKYRASYDEMQTWLTLYNDHPNASKLYKIAKARKPKSAANPPKSTYRVGITGRIDLDAGKAAERYKSKRKRSRVQYNRMRDLKKLIRRDISKTAPTRAYKRLQTAEFKQLFDNVEYDQIRADIANSYFFAGKFDKSLKLAKESADRSGTDVPVAGWVAGLSLWQAKEYKQAAHYFEQVAKSKRATAWTVTAGAYWAARAHLRDKQPRLASYWLKQAAAHPYSFYGLIANRALGVRHIRFDWDVPELRQADLHEIMQEKYGQRAIALLDAGQYYLAEQELRQISIRKKPHLEQALLSLAEEYKLPGLALRLGGAVKRDNGRLYDAALYPLAPWQPENGFEVDRALVYAFIRQESRFDPAVSSHTGASGLMQLMPRTASYVAGKSAKHFSGKNGKRKLYDPILNIDLGQQYLNDLLNLSVVDNNLFRLTVSYNAGQGRMAKWEKKMQHNDDPLLFIESIPAAETRAFVERVMTNYWVYRMRMNQYTPSLDAVASGKWPLYYAQDAGRKAVFASIDHDGWRKFAAAR